MTIIELSIYSQYRKKGLSFCTYLSDLLEFFGSSEFNPLHIFKNLHDILSFKSPKRRIQNEVEFQTFAIIS